MASAGKAVLKLHWHRRCAGAGELGARPGQGGAHPGRVCGGGLLLRRAPHDGADALRPRRGPLHQNVRSQLQRCHKPSLKPSRATLVHFGKQIACLQQGLCPLLWLMDMQHLHPRLSRCKGWGGPCRALERTGVSPEEVNYVNAHATSTPAGDLAEYRAIRAAIPGQHVRMNATKSMIGHLLGAAGAVEAIATVQAIRTGTGTLRAGAASKALAARKHQVLAELPFSSCSEMALLRPNLRGALLWSRQPGCSA